MTTFFTDRDLGKAFPVALAVAGIDVVAHRDLFGDECTDETWLAEVGLRGWVALTHDQRIRYRPNQLAAVVRHRVRLLVIIGKAPNASLAENFVLTLPRVSEFIAGRESPWIAKIYRGAGEGRPGSIAHWYPQDP